MQSKIILWDKSSWSLHKFVHFLAVLGTICLWDVLHHTRLIFLFFQNSGCVQTSLMFSSFSLAENLPRNLQITAYISLHIMVCSCAMPSNCANNILLMRKWNHAFLLALTWKWQIFIEKQIGNDKTIIELSCRKISWFGSVSPINSLSIMYLLATDKSRYSAQPFPVINDY